MSRQIKELSFFRTTTVLANRVLFSSWIFSWFFIFSNNNINFFLKKCTCPALAPSWGRKKVSSEPESNQRPFELQSNALPLSYRCTAVNELLSLNLKSTLEHSKTSTRVDFGGQLFTYLLMPFVSKNNKSLCIFELKV
jgi:hypothetical protein